MADSTSRKIIEYVADMKDVFRKLKTLDSANKKAANSLGTGFSKNLKTIGEGYGKIAKTDTSKLSGNITQLGNTTSKWSQTVKGADGQLLKLTETTKINDKGVVKTTQSYQNLSKNTVSVAQNLSRLAKRAALTIPLWLVLRGAITGVISTFKNGIRDIAAFDRVLQKARRNLQGTPQEIEANFKNLRDEVTKLSLESGKSVEEIANAFQRFATVGFDFETSMTGAAESTKLAVTLFGSTEKNANALARAFRILSKNIDDGRTKSEQLQGVTALLADLWKDQAFTIDEMAGALERFAPVARIANFTMEQTIQSLAAIQTAGIRGTRAGRLLSTAVLQMDKNFDKFQSTLGLNVNPQMTTTFERLQLVVKEIGKLQKVDPLAATQALQELFGGVRGLQVPAALSADFENLVNVLSRTGDIDAFQKSFEEITKTTGILTGRIQNVNKEIGKAFITGLFGGDDFNDTLQIILESLQKIQFQAIGAGTTLNALFAPFRGESSFEVLVEGATTAQAQIVRRFNQIAIESRKAIENGLSETDFNKLSKSIGILKKDILEFGTDFATENIGNLKSLEKINGLLQENLNITKEQTKQEAKLGEEKKKQLSDVQLNVINNAVISSQLEQLKNQGALTSEIIDRTNRLEDIFKINRDLETSLDRQLEKERALREEKRLQAELGNESLKLFRIAQEQGTATAKKISEVLAGDVDFSTFILRGGEVAEIFKKEFAGLFEQQQALQFFRGESVTGQKGLQGGAGITLPTEDLAIRGLPSTAEASRSRSRLMSGVQAAQNVQNINQVSASTNITANIDISKLDEVSNKVIDEIAKQLPRAGSEINLALKNALVGKQTRTI